MELTCGALSWVGSADETEMGGRQFGSTLPCPYAISLAICFLCSPADLPT